MAGGGRERAGRRGGHHRVVRGFARGGNGAVPPLGKKKKVADGRMTCPRLRVQSSRARRRPSFRVQTRPNEAFRNRRVGFEKYVVEVGVSARRAHGKRIVHHIVARDRAAIISI